MKPQYWLMPMAAAPMAAFATGGATTPERPNVIIIYADDLGYGDLECYGALNVETPNVNRLAERGIKFNNTYAAAATSTPSRYAMLTGEYAWRQPNTDVAPGNAGMIIRPEQYTVADVFRNAGYSTGAFGKWHLGLGDKTGQQDWNAPLPCGVNDLGFDYSYIMAATADRVPCVFIENGHVANYDPDAPIEVNYYKNFPGEPTGADNPELLYNQRPSHGHDQSIVNGIPRIGYMKGGGKALWKDENIADSIAAHAIGFMEQHKDEPFFMYVATNDVHVPRFPHDRFRGKNKMGVRGDAIAQFDWTVGEVVNALERLGLTDNTLIILSSDNGPVVDDGYADEAEERLNGHSPTGHLRGGKYSAFEGGTRVPMIVAWGDKLKGKGNPDALMSQIDWLASFSALVGNQPIPSGSAPDSFNRLGNILGEDASDRPWVVQQAANKTLSVRTPEWKYIDISEWGPMISWGPKIESGYAPLPQLYNMKEANDEMENVAMQYPQQVYDLQRLMALIRSKNYSKMESLGQHP